MRDLIRAAVVGLALVSSAGAGAGALHFSLVKSTPEKDKTLEAAPARLQVWFSQVPAAVVSEITLKRDTADVALGKTVIVAAEKSMYAEPAKPLADGAYTLTWRAAGDDGHVMSGDIKFVLKIKTAK